MNLTLSRVKPSCLTAATPSHNRSFLLARHSHIAILAKGGFANVVGELVLSEDKKKRAYYYGGKEKSAGEIKKADQEIEHYRTIDIQREFNRLMDSFLRDFEDFWDTSWRFGRDMRSRARSSIAPFTASMFPSVDLEDQGKAFHLTVDLPGFKKEEVDVEVEEDAVTVSAKRSTSEDEKGKNYIRRERSAQTYYRKIALPEAVRSDQANAKLNNGALEVILPKKEPKETKKLTIA